MTATDPGCRQIYPPETREKARALFMQHKRRADIALALRVPENRVKKWITDCGWVAERLVADVKAVATARAPQRNSYSPEVREAARLLYVAERKTYLEVAAAMGLPAYTVADWVSKQGWTAQRDRAAPPPPEMKERAKRLYMSGRGYVGLAKELGITERQMRRWIDHGGWARERAAMQAREGIGRNSSPLQREAQQQVHRQNFATFAARKAMPKPSEAEVSRIVAEFLAHRSVTVCPPAYCAPVQSEVIRPSYRTGGWTP